MPECFAFLGLGARGKNFRDCHYPVPGGELVWLRWRDRNWATGADRPVLMGLATPAEQEAMDPQPPELSEEWLDLCPEAGRFVVAIDDSGPWEHPSLAAAAVADAIVGLMSFNGALLEEIPLVRLEPGWVDAGEVVIQELFERDRDLMMPTDWSLQIRAAAAIDVTRLDAYLRSLDTVLSDGDRVSHGLFPALVYHQLSVLEYGFAPSDRPDVLDGHLDMPDTPFHRARAEESFHNAWKSIEAALGGEPSKDETNLRKKLEGRGVDPDSDARFPTKDGRTLIERIRRLHGVRDKSSAHGGRTGGSRAPITYADLVEVQWVAAELIQVPATATPNPA